ncbi:MAG: 2,3-bisphosphoglycerate-dependent phosphoglycerate mutase [Sphingobacteriales bacterium]|nr:MAG: 2,3-bisphosphoglycerate-dependent phosphoglycerate mutase [Sphingobacteriales bacterium]
MHILILTRHGQSEGNKRNEFTGWADLPLTEQGRDEAKSAGQRLKDAGYSNVSAAFSSVLQRAATTCDIILAELGQSSLCVTRNQALNERDYGDLTGLNKDQARQQFGEEQVHIWRRAYDTPPPGGESLKDTVARVLPYYVHNVMPTVLSSDTTLVAAHGNSLRALIMAIEGIASEDIPQVELATGEIYVYKLENSSKIIDKQILKP